MKKFWIVFLVVVCICLAVFFVFRFFNKDNNDFGRQLSNYEASRVSVNDYNNDDLNNLNENKVVESEISNFSTDILSDDKDRLTNIKITCSRINGTTVKAGKEFSFCDVVGQPSSDDGYKPADAFGSNGKVIQAIGGGNCQVSTTIYNAALKADGLKITERHEHDRDVAYIEDGKDATVAYDYLDLKFKNTNDFDIKLYASVYNDKVIVRICKIS